MCKRNNCLDIAKGIAALLMVWGHCIQFGNGSTFLQQQCYYDDVAYRLIYSFHMPLFAIIGGYLLSCSLKKRNALSVMSTRLRSLGLPIIVWSLVNYLIEISTHGLADGIIGIMKQYFWTLVSTHWFLWAMLFCSICVILIHGACNNSVVAFIAVFVLSMIIPDKFNLSYFKFLYPFFAIGYLWGDKSIGKRMKDLLLDKAKLAWVVLLIIWLVLLTQFHKEMFIYQSGFTLLGKENPGKQLFIDIFRVLIGVCGSAWMLLLTSFLDGTIWGTAFAKLGKRSLGVYIINSYINLYILKPLCANVSSSSLWIILLTSVTTAVCFALASLVERNRILNKFLFGGR